MKSTNFREVRKRGPSPRHVRRRLIALWLELADELSLLEQAFRGAPPQSFTASERAGALHALDQVWFELSNQRPWQRPTPHRREARRLKLLRLIDSLSDTT